MTAPLEIIPEATPNPNGLKFSLNRTLTEKSLWFSTPQAAEVHPVARALAAVPGVKSIMIAATFVSVNKDPAADWAAIVPQVETVLRRTVP